MKASKLWMVLGKNLSKKSRVPCMMRCEKTQMIMKAWMLTLTQDLPSQQAVKKVKNGIPK